MNCPNCRRSVPQHRTECLYCGMPIPTQPDRGARPSEPDQEARQAVLDALPRELRREVEAALNQALQKGASNEHVDNAPPHRSEDTDAAQNSPPTGIAEVLESCDVARKQFDADIFDYDEYRQMVMNALRGYVDQMENKAKLNYVLYDIKNAPECDYLDDEMLKSLQHHAVATAAGTGMPQPVKRSRRFGWLKWWRKK